MTVLAQTLVLSAVALACFLLPPVSFSRGVPTGAGGQMLTAEMASLEPKSEPELVAADPE